MRRLRGVVVFKASKPTIQWHDQPKPASFNRAERELDRLNVPDAKAAADELRHGDVKMVAAGELVRRMTGRELPAVDDDRVQREVQRIRTAGDSARSWSSATVSPTVSIAWAQYIISMTPLRLPSSPSEVTPKNERWTRCPR